LIYFSITQFGLILQLYLSTTPLALVYELDAQLKPIRHYYLGDPAAIAAAQQAVASQGKTK
jgi:hypothetical protein